MSKKPYQYKLKLDKECNNIVDYSVASKEEIKWNSRKTILFISQNNETFKSKKNIFRFISYDVVRIICVYIWNIQITN